MPKPILADFDTEQEDLSVFFGALEDPRIERKKLYPLREIFFLALASVLAGADGWRSMEFFGEARLTWLR